MIVFPGGLSDGFPYVRFAQYLLRSRYVTTAVVSISTLKASRTTIEEAGGEDRIRTCGCLRNDGFQDRYLQPLGHLSGWEAPEKAG